ncbi:MAG TPA: hypothetical protein VE621_14325 [Bryobacteraceae bacterium]|nr:hypothetical protein [Bryobacteraceae bacterium]
METAHDRGVGCEGAVFDALLVDVARSERELVGFGVEAETVLEVALVIEAADISGCLRSGAKGPALLVSGECSSVRGRGL